MKVSKEKSDLDICNISGSNIGYDNQSNNDLDKLYDFSAVGSNNNIKSIAT